MEVNKEQLTLLQRMRNGYNPDWQEIERSLGGEPKGKPLDDIILGLVFIAGQKSMMEKTENIVKKSFVK